MSKWRFRKSVLNRRMPLTAHTFLNQKLKRQTAIRCGVRFKNIQDRNTCVMKIMRFWLFGKFFRNFLAVALAVILFEQIKIEKRVIVAFKLTKLSNFFKSNKFSIFIIHFKNPAFWHKRIVDIACCTIYKAINNNI